MTPKPKTRKAAVAPPRKPAVIDDPIFALIAEHKALTKKMYGLSKKLDEATFEARETHGRRPFELIAWRSYSAIGGSEIDRARAEFLGEPGADRKQIAKEYRDAKTREIAAERAGVEWDERAGVAPLREQYERADLAERKAAMRMARTKPVTPAGAAALVEHARRDIDTGMDMTGWPTVALKTVVRALCRNGGMTVTTNPKTRKSPAKAAAPVKGKAFGDQKREVSDIRKLVSRCLPGRDPTPADVERARAKAAQSGQRFVIVGGLPSKLESRTDGVSIGRPCVFESQGP